MLAQPDGQLDPLEDQVNGYDTVLGTHTVDISFQRGISAAPAPRGKVCARGGTTRACA
jgi:hypothetical protein